MVLLIKKMKNINTLQLFLYIFFKREKQNLLLCKIGGRVVH